MDLPDSDGETNGHVEGEGIVGKTWDQVVLKKEDEGVSGSYETDLKDTLAHLPGGGTGHRYPKVLSPDGQELEIKCLTCVPSAKRIKVCLDLYQSHFKYFIQHARGQKHTRLAIQMAHDRQRDASNAVPQSAEVALMEDARSSRTTRLVEPVNAEVCLVCPHCAHYMGSAFG